MTLEKFASEQIDEYERLIEDVYDDAVYLTNEKYAVPMDKFYPYGGTRREVLHREHSPDALKRT